MAALVRYENVCYIYRMELTDEQYQLYLEVPGLFWETRNNEDWELELVKEKDTGRDEFVEEEDE